MLVGFFNAVKVESVPLKSTEIAGPFDRAFGPLLFERMNCLSA
jgi:hypothetical protein